MKNNRVVIHNGFWYTAKSGKNLGDIIYIKDCDIPRRKPQPFMITGIGRTTTKWVGVIYREYYVIQPRRRFSDKKANKNRRLSDSPKRRKGDLV